MDAKKVDLFIMGNKEYFPAEKIVFLKSKLASTSDDRFDLIQAMEFKKPLTLLLISIFLGSLGIDRFMLKDTGMGILKLLTGGLCGILTIIDWFSIQKKAQEKNFNDLMQIL